MKKTISPRIRDESREFYSTFFRAANTGAGYTLDSYPALVVGAIDGLRGRFSENELRLMVFSMRGYLLSPQAAGRQIVARCASAIMMRTADAAWNVSVSDFVERLAALSLWERNVIEIWCNRFWSSESGVDLEGRLRDYCDQLI